MTPLAAGTGGSLKSPTYYFLFTNLSVLSMSPPYPIFVSLRYEQWRILMEPTKYPLNEEDTKWSKWLESVRKDVECFFGIL